jgi:hypothetical protein
MSWEQFLEEIAREHQLTPEQKEAFLARFNKNETQAAIALNIDLFAFKHRMKDVYKKFARSCPEINSRGRGKFEKLVAWLQKRYQEQKSEIRQVALLSSNPADIAISNQVLSNPFGKTGRIAKPEDFFGREDLLEHLFESLNQGGNLSLVGEDQIGKSSILSMICHWGSKRMQLPSEAFIYLDMQNIHNENEFFEALCDRLGISVCRGYNLAKALSGKRYIVCIDEVEKMTRKEHFSGAEREELRGLAGGDSTPLSLVIASRSPLDRLFPGSDSMTSPLYNICRQINVEPFSPDVARAFITTRLKGTGIFFTESQINQLIEETQGHPARLQQAAADLYRSLRKS